MECVNMLPMQCVAVSSKLYYANLRIYVRIFEFSKIHTENARM